MSIVPDTPENMQRCICADCLSYPGEGDPIAPRARALPVTEVGCTCGDCAVFKDYGLPGRPHCVAGAAGEGAK